MTFIN